MGVLAYPESKDQIGFFWLNRTYFAHVAKYVLLKIKEKIFQVSFLYALNDVVGSAFFLSKMDAFWVFIGLHYGYLFRCLIG